MKNAKIIFLVNFLPRTSSPVIWLGFSRENSHSKVQGLRRGTFMSLKVARELLASAGYQLELERKPSSHAVVATKGSLRTGVQKLQPLWGQERGRAGGCCEMGEVCTEWEESEGALGPSVSICHQAWPSDPLLPPFQIPGELLLLDIFSLEPHREGCSGKHSPSHNQKQ